MHGFGGHTRRRVRQVADHHRQAAGTFGERTGVVSLRDNQDDICTHRGQFQRRGNVVYHHREAQLSGGTLWAICCFWDHEAASLSYHLSVGVRLLGGAEVVVGNSRTTVSRRQEQIVLAVLALRAGRPVPVTRLVDALWGEHIPPSADKAVQAVVSRLRSATGLGVERRGESYVLDLEPDAVDAVRFETLVGSARSGPATERAERLRAALSGWGGDLLGDDPTLCPVRDSARLAELHSSATEELFEAELDSGFSVDPVEIESFLTDHPYRERSWAALIVALYRLGRQADALAAYQRARARLVEDLGVEPGPELRRAQLAVLTQDDALLAGRRLTLMRPPPAPLDSIVGRQTEIEEFSALLANGRLLTLVGLGGIGKTRLAAELARRAAREFADGVCFVELADVESDRILSAVVDAGAVDLVGGVTNAGELLLVLDNCEHVLPDVSDLALRWLGAHPELRILATSRESLGIPGETVREVGPLPVMAGAGADGAIDLLVERAKAAAPRLALDGAAVRELNRICEIVSGIPLALELAASRLATTDPKSLADELAQRADALTRPRRTHTGRHSSMEDALAWSFERLTEAERETLTRLAVFRGGFQRDVLPPESGDAIDGLVSSSLVTFDGQRYSILEPVRQFAMRHSAPAQLESARNGQADWAVAFAEDAGRNLMTDQRAWANRVDTERANLAAAIDWSLGRPGDLRAARILAALGVAWSLQGGQQEVAWIERALASTVGDERLRGRALIAAAALARSSLHPQLAATWAREAVDYYRRQNNARGLAWALFQAAMCELMQVRRDAEVPRGEFSECAGLFSGIGDHFGAGWSLANLGHLHIVVGDDKAAAPYLEQALEMADQHGIEHVAGIAFRELGRIAYNNGDADAGLEGMRRAVAIYRNQGDRWQLANALSVLIFTVGVERPWVALSAAEELLALVESSGMVDQLTNATLATAWLAAQRNPAGAASPVGGWALTLADGARYWSLGSDQIISDLEEAIGKRRQRVPSFAQVVRESWSCLAEIRESLSPLPDLQA